MNIDDLQANSKQASDFLKSMANENRLMILCSLIEGEISVSELNNQISLSQSALSQHLASLREAGLVVSRRQSQAIYYRLNGDNAVRVLTVLKEIFCP